MIWDGLEDLAATYSPVPWGTVPWALGVFTAEFGMGSGAGPPPKPPGRPTHPQASRTTAPGIGCDEVLVRAARACCARARAVCFVRCVLCGVFCAECAANPACLPLITDHRSLITDACCGWWDDSRACRAIRTGQLRASPRFHIRPIDVMVYHGPSGCYPWETWFRGGFPA